MFVVLLAPASRSFARLLALTFCSSLPAFALYVIKQEEVKNTARVSCASLICIRDLTWPRACCVSIGGKLLTLMMMMMIALRVPTGSKLVFVCLFSLFFVRPKMMNKKNDFK